MFLQGIRAFQLLEIHLTQNHQSICSANYFNYINMTSSDNSGMLRFLTDELQDAEDAGDRGMGCIRASELTISTCFKVWIIGHVLTGWDGSNPLQNPTNLCELNRFCSGYSPSDLDIYSLSDVNCYTTSTAACSY